MDTNMKTTNEALPAASKKIASCGFIYCNGQATHIAFQKNSDHPGLYVCLAHAIAIYKVSNQLRHNFYYEALPER
jgi:hypothetical protein